MADPYDSQVQRLPKAQFPGDKRVPVDDNTGTPKYARLDDLAGQDGQDGAQGERGPAGADGAAGAKGDKGDRGDRGPAGADGAAGATGPAGPAGADGARGPAGPAGADGARGPAGPAGADGADGAALNAAGLANLLDDGTGSSSPPANAVMGARDPVSGGLLSIELQNLPGGSGGGGTGPAGPAGPQGERGEKGDKGDPGDRGPAGPAGADGRNGIDGQPGMNGRDGAQGPAGPQGPQGPQGPRGPAGSGEGSEPEDSFAQQFSVLEVFDGLDAHTITAGSTAADEFRVAFDGTARQDEADIGLSHASGRTSFTRIPASALTYLRVTGLLPYYLTDTPAGDLRVELREFDSLNAAGTTQTLLETALPASTGTTNYDLPLGDTGVNVRRGFTYEVWVIFAPRTATGSGAAHGIRAGADSADLIAFRNYSEAGAAVPAPNATTEEGFTLKARTGAPVWEFEPDIPDTVPEPARGVPSFLRVSNGAGNRPVISIEELADFAAARSVASLAVAPQHAGDQVRLTALDGDNYPGVYLGVATTLTRNEARGTIGSRSVTPQQGSPAVTEYGWSRAASPNGYGEVTQGGAYVAKASWFTFEGATPFNIFVRNSIADSRATIYAEVMSSETSTIVGTDFQRTTGRLTVDGVTFSEYQSITPLSNAEVTALNNIADASGNNDIQVRLFEANGNARGNAINFLPAYVWEAYLGQHHIQPFIEEANAADRILRGRRIYGDWPDLGIFESTSAAASVVTQANAGKTFSVQASRSEDIDRYVIASGFPGTDATRGATNRRNRIKARLLPFGHGNGSYYTSGVRSLLRTFDNVEDLARVDNQLRIGSLTFGDGDARNPLYMSVGISDSLTTAQSIFVNVTNRETSAGTAITAGLSLTLTRQTGENSTGRFANRDYHFYRVDVAAASRAGLNLQDGWIFQDEEVVVDFFTDSGESTPLNFSPDEVQFTAGTGYAAATNAIAPSAVEIAGGSGGGGSIGSVTQETIAASTTIPSPILSFGAWTNLAEFTGLSGGYEFNVNFTASAAQSGGNNRVWVEFRLRERTAGQSGLAGTQEGITHQEYYRVYPHTLSLNDQFSMDGFGLEAGNTYAIDVRASAFTSQNYSGIETTSGGFVNAVPLGVSG